MAMREVHPNWDQLMDFCRKAGHGEMALTFADGIPVFAKTVQVQMRFGPVHVDARPVRAPALDAPEATGRTGSK
jgi:hypothetical protein